jgi:hypothetical protein
MLIYTSFVAMLNVVIVAKYSDLHRKMEFVSSVIYIYIYIYELQYMYVKTDEVSRIPRSLFGTHPSLFIFRYVGCENLHWLRVRQPWLNSHYMQTSCGANQASNPWG